MNRRGFLSTIVGAAMSLLGMGAATKVTDCRATIDGPLDPRISPEQAKEFRDAFLKFMNSKGCYTAKIQYELPGMSAWRGPLAGRQGA